MANTDSANGLKAVGIFGGGTPGRSNAYTIASGYAGDIFNGNPVKSSGTGKGIVTAAAGNIMTGVFAGVSYTDAQGDVQYRNYWPTGTVATDIVAHVYDDPKTIFEVQADEDIVAADIGSTADLVNTTSGSTSTGQGTAELDSSSVASGAGLKIIELVDRPGNAYGNFAKVLVLINEHEYNSAVAAV